jgi:hypothetical protein
MDSTDRKLAEQMVRLHTDTLDFLRSTPDTPYAEIAYTMGRLAFWSQKLHSMTFGQIVGCSR